jgi:hypothetical protein
MLLGMQTGQPPVDATVAKKPATASDVVSALRPRLGGLVPRSARDRFWETTFRLRWRIPSPPAWSDWSGYSRLLVEIERNRIADVPGDVVEIGVLLGGGTYKLCKYFEREAPEKRVYAVDIFDPSFDTTAGAEGDTMAQLYEQALGDTVIHGRSQREIFDHITRDCRNLTVLAEDSATVDLPADRLAFAYVDGNHSAPYVRSDFELVWSRLSPGGIVGLDDYGDTIDDVTDTMHQLIGEHAAEIARIWTAAPKTLFVQRAR